MLHRVSFGGHLGEVAAKTSFSSFYCPLVRTYLATWMADPRSDTSAYLGESSCMSRLTLLAKDAYCPTTQHDQISNSSANREHVKITTRSYLGRP
jgi:hypothetical protein